MDAYTSTNGIPKHHQFQTESEKKGKGQGQGQIIKTLQNCFPLLSDGDEFSTQNMNWKHRTGTQILPLKT